MDSNSSSDITMALCFLQISRIFIIWLWLFWASATSSWLLTFYWFGWLSENFVAWKAVQQCHIWSLGGFMMFNSKVRSCWAIFWGIWIPHMFWPFWSVWSSQEPFPPHHLFFSAFSFPFCCRVIRALFILANIGAIAVYPVEIKIRYQFTK